MHPSLLMSRWGWELPLAVCSPAALSSSLFPPGIRRVTESHREPEGSVEEGRRRVSKDSEEGD
eukprot:2650271-Rhodomonas_salina.2